MQCNVLYCTVMNVRTVQYSTVHYITLHTYIHARIILHRLVAWPEALWIPLRPQQTLQISASFLVGEAQRLRGGIVLVEPKPAKCWQKDSQRVDYSWLYLKMPTESEVVTYCSSFPNESLVVNCIQLCFWHCWYICRAHRVWSDGYQLPPEKV